MVGIRYDYFLIWGNGLQYKDDIIAMIRENENFEITKFMFYEPSSIKNFVKAVYSYDYAPFYHLKSKTKYLMTTVSKVAIIFVKNKNPDEDYFGEDDFRHIESRTIKILKEKIRDAFNERKDDRRTENHVVHASDNIGQVDYLLKYLGFEDGLKYLMHQPNSIVFAPYHIERFHKISIKEISIDDIYCTIFNKKNSTIDKAIIPIENTPQYKCLLGEHEVYQKYLSDFWGYQLTDNYSVKKLLLLYENFDYLNGQNFNHYILVKKNDEIGKYIVQDGVHRASILAYKGYKKAIVAVIE